MSCKKRKLSSNSPPLSSPCTPPPQLEEEYTSEPEYEDPDDEDEPTWDCFDINFGDEEEAEQEQDEEEPEDCNYDDPDLPVEQPEEIKSSSPESNFLPRHSHESCSSLKSSERTNEVFTDPLLIANSLLSLLPPPLPDDKLQI